MKLLTLDITLKVRVIRPIPAGEVSDALRPGDAPISEEDRASLVEKFREEYSSRGEDGIEFAGATIDACRVVEV